MLKEDNLPRAVYPATLVSLILSDVPGDPLDVIASGPTTPDPTTFSQALDVLEKFNFNSVEADRISNYLRMGIDGLFEKHQSRAILFLRKSPI